MRDKTQSPAGNFVAVTPHDTNPVVADIDSQQISTRGLYIGAAGNVKITSADGQTVTFTALAVGVIHPIAARIVWATGTTATGIVAAF